MVFAYENSSLPPNEPTNLHISLTHSWQLSSAGCGYQYLGRWIYAYVRISANGDVMRHSPISYPRKFEYEWGSSRNISSKLFGAIFRRVVRFHGTSNARTRSKETRRKMVNIIISGTWEPHAALCCVINGDHATADHLFSATPFYQPRSDTIWTLHVVYTQTQSNMQSPLNNFYIYIYMPEWIWLF